MAHIVICKYCKERFDRDIEPFVDVGGRRYAHKKCVEQIENSFSQEEKDYLNLEKYIKNLFKVNNLNAKTKRQIRDFRQEYNFTYTGILKTLYWWYEIKGHTTELSKDGIGIVPYIYDDAEKYYYTLYLAKIVNNTVNEYKTQINEIEIPSPRIQVKPPKMFDLDSIEQNKK